MPSENVLRTLDIARQHLWEDNGDVVLQMVEQLAQGLEAQDPDHLAAFVESWDV